jgi:hypothetical protein
MRSAELEDQINAARRLSKSFTGQEPARVVKVQRRVPHVALAIGQLDFVGYTTVRDGRTEKYIHRFTKQRRPLLAASHDGAQLEILGGDFRFKSLGIVG